MVQQLILNLTVPKIIYIMSNFFKILVILTLHVVYFSCAQTTMEVISDAKKIQSNKKEFIGKPLNYLLHNIKLEIKSVVPAPNKNQNEVNRISFIFVPYDVYQKTSEYIQDRPTRITVVFNQNSDLVGERCTNVQKGCTTWTKEDEKVLGDLIVYDLYVLGKN